MADEPTTKPVRIDAPTPAGGAYALIYAHQDGRLEVVEFDEDGREIRRTYTKGKTDG